MIQCTKSQLRTIIGIRIIRIFTCRRHTADSYILINSYTHLIEGLDANKEKSGKLYNEYIIDGDFFSPPTGRSIL